MVWQQQSACICKIVVVCVALWLVVRLAGCRASRRLCSVYTRAGFLSQILVRQLTLAARHQSQDQMGSNGAGSRALWRVGVRDVTVPLVQLETTAAHLR
jgi:hypothetical protein